MPHASLDVFLLHKHKSSICVESTCVSYIFIAIFFPSDTNFSKFLLLLKNKMEKTKKLFSFVFYLLFLVIWTWTKKIFRTRFLIFVSFIETMRFDYNCFTTIVVFFYSFYSLENIRHVEKKSNCFILLCFFL